MSLPIIIIGAGPSGLMAAQKLAEVGFKVHVYEQNKAAARKFLVAGNGGFNLTHSENIDDFISKYDNIVLDPIIRNFDSNQTRKWLNELGIKTYIGSSGKIFPIKIHKPIHVLQAWLRKLEDLDVEIHYNHRFINFDKNTVTIMHQNKQQQHSFHSLIFGLGGASWQKTGSDAKWTSVFNSKSIQLIDFESANSGYETVNDYRLMEGGVLKNIETRFKNRRKKGELVFTKYGIEGSPIYYLNRFTRAHKFPLTIYLDLKPSLSEQHIEELLLTNKEKTTVALKDKLKLNKTAINLIKTLDKDIFISSKSLSHTIKNFPIAVKSLRPIDEVISSSGGIDFNELDTSLALRKYPNIYCIGEMLNWEAPTGGYLLQACFSMGKWCSQHIIDSKLNEHVPLSQ